MLYDGRRELAMAAVTANVHVLIQQMNNVYYVSQSNCK